MLYLGSIDWILRKCHYLNDHVACTRLHLLHFEQVLLSCWQCCTLAPSTAFSASASTLLTTLHLGCIGCFFAQVPLYWWQCCTLAPSTAFCASTIILLTMLYHSCIGCFLRKCCNLVDYVVSWLHWLLFARVPLSYWPCCTLAVLTAFCTSAIILLAILYLGCIDCFLHKCHYLIGQVVPCLY